MLQSPLWSLYYLLNAANFVMPFSVLIFRPQLLSQSLPITLVLAGTAGAFMFFLFIQSQTLGGRFIWGSLFSDKSAVQDLIDYLFCHCPG